MLVDTVEGEFYDPVASDFRVKLVGNGVLIDFRFRGLQKGWEGVGVGVGGKQVAGNSFGNLHFVCRSVLSL